MLSMTADLALAILVLASLFMAAILFAMRRGLTEKLSPQGYVLLCGFTASYYVPAVGWLMGISSLMNDVDNPVLRGTGGYYGLNTAYFPNALMVYTLTPVIALLASLFISKRSNAAINENLFARIGGSLRIGRISAIAMVGAIMLTVWYFQVVGWDRFWYSNLARFEFDDYGRGDFSLKIALTLVLAFGCMGAGLAVFRGSFLTSTITVIAASLPFLAFASRGFTVLVAAYCIAIFLRVPAKRRWLVSVPILMAIYFALELPMGMRTGSQTGLRAAYESMAGDGQSDFGMKDSLASSMQNIGQGFGLLVEEREAADTGRKIIDGIPLTYFVLSVSPTFSMIDKFDVNWISYHPRFNIYTPFSGLCEIVSSSLFLGFLVPVMIYLAGAWLCRRISGRSLWHDAVLFGFVLIISLGFLQFQQYPLRTAMRFMYAAFAMVGAFNFLAFMATTHYAGKQLATISNFLVQQQSSRIQAMRQKK